MFFYLRVFSTAKNYDQDGFTPRFTAIEYSLGVLTEWIAYVLRHTFSYCLIASSSAVLLNVTYFTSRNDPPKGEFVALRKVPSAEGEA